MCHLAARIAKAGFDFHSNDNIRCVLWHMVNKTAKGKCLMQIVFPSNEQPILWNSVEQINCSV